MCKSNEQLKLYGHFTKAWFNHFSRICDSLAVNCLQTNTKAKQEIKNKELKIKKGAHMLLQDKQPKAFHSITNWHVKAIALQWMLPTQFSLFNPFKYILFILLRSRSLLELCEWFVASIGIERAVSLTLFDSGVQSVWVINIRYSAKRLIKYTMKFTSFNWCWLTSIEVGSQASYFS